MTACQGVQGLRDETLNRMHCRLISNTADIPSHYHCGIIPPSGLDKIARRTRQQFSNQRIGKLAPDADGIELFVDIG